MCPGIPALSFIYLSVQLYTNKSEILFKPYKYFTRFEVSEIIVPRQITIIIYRESTEYLDSGICIEYYVNSRGN